MFDVTARKTHQWTMVVLVAAGFVAGGRWGGALLVLAGAIMLAGRFWWPADAVRQLVWLVLEPAGVLRRVERVEDHETRRLARTVGGAIWLLAGATLLLGLGGGGLIAAWIVTLAIVAMVVLDAALDFCALCFLFLQLESRGLLPAGLRHTAAGR